MVYLGVVREVGVEDVLDIGGVDGEVDAGGEEGEGNSAALIGEEGVAPVVEAVEVLGRLIVAPHQRPRPRPRLPALRLKHRIIIPYYIFA